MANHASAKKRIRQNETRRIRNRYHSVTARNAIAILRETKDKAEAEKQYPVVIAMLDKLAKRGTIHKKKASNLKSKLAKHINKL